METTNVRQIFEPLLRDFCESTKNIDIDDNFSSVFLPHTMDKYNKSKTKIFYFGRDTYGWTPTSKLMQAYSSNNLLSYFEESGKWARNFGFLDYNNNKASGFWTIAIRLHLRIKGFTENLKISENLPEKYYDHINDFGWGNTNSIEVPKSLENQDIWETLDKDKYWAIKQKSKIFDKLVYTINAYKPDLIFIFNWDCNEKEFLDGLDYQKQEHDLISWYLHSYILSKTKTKIIWTVHPTYARFLGYGADSIIDEIIEYLKQ
ncbi:MAG TPA: hypothetical protein VIH57_21755 [Bacteroidales bacterium]